MKEKRAPQVGRRLSIFLLALTLLTATACSNGTSANSIVDDAFNSILGDSANVSAVKDAYLESCPTVTLGQMADAYMVEPTWSDFPSDSGGTIVELDGYITFDGAPVSALIQFNLIGGSFEAVYLGINSVDQSLLMLSALLTNMCEATY